MEIRDEESKVTPKALRERYEQYKKNPDLLAYHNCKDILEEAKRLSMLDEDDTKHHFFIQACLIAYTANTDDLREHILKGIACVFPKTVQLESILTESNFNKIQQLWFLENVNILSGTKKPNPSDTSLTEQFGTFFLGKEFTISHDDENPIPLSEKLELYRKQPTDQAKTQRTELLEEINDFRKQYKPNAQLTDEHNPVKITDQLLRCSYSYEDIVLKIQLLIESKWKRYLIHTDPQNKKDALRAVAAQKFFTHKIPGELRKIDCLLDIMSQICLNQEPKAILKAVISAQTTFKALKITDKEIDPLLKNLEKALSSPTRVEEDSILIDNTPKK